MTGRNLLRRLLPLWPLLAVGLLWQALVSWGHYTSLVLPTPQAVLTDLGSHPAAYVRDVLATTQVAVAGLAAGLAAGTLAAVAAWGSRLLSGLLTPIAVGLYAVPTLAFIPLIAQVLGYNGRTVIAVAAVISFFPAFVYGSAGLRDLPPGSAALFRSLGAGRLTVLVRLALPAAARQLLVALRVSASTGVVAAVVAEYLMGTDGLGRSFVYHYRRFETDRAFGIALVVMVLSFATYALAGRLERWGTERLD